jgi:hypothetical protein
LFVCTVTIRDSIKRSHRRRKRREEKRREEKRREEEKGEHWGIFVQRMDGTGRMWENCGTVCTRVEAVSRGSRANTNQEASKCGLESSRKFWPVDVFSPFGKGEKMNSRGF